MSAYGIISEVWKSVVGYEGRYEVSDFGNVKSLPRIESRSNGVPVNIYGGSLKPSVAKQSGHVRVNLRKGGKSKTCWIHQLVMAAFIGERPLGYEVCHKDGVPANNRVGNLRWGTRSENIEDRRAHGTLVCGEAVLSAKLSVAQVISIKEALRLGERLCDLAEKFNVSASCVHRIKAGKGWTHV